MFVGKILYTLAGLLVTGHPLGAVVGFVLGALYDVWHTQVYMPRVAKEQWEQDFSFATIMLFAKVAKADGVVTPEEIRTFKSLFHIKKDDEDAVGAVFNAGRRKVEGFEEHAQRLRDLCVGEEERLKGVMTNLYIMAQSNGAMHAQQHAVLQAICRVLGLGDGYFAALESRLHGQSSQREAPRRGHQKRAVTMENGDNPYTVLGVPESADEEAVKKAYKKLIRTHHPDKLKGEGASAAKIKKAEEKVAHINAAYKTIRDA